ncbi:nucleotidyltransferase domain-containing protein [Pseudomonas canadensis]|uniref:nucleotidyltransferase domain-containing protein n=1 Tax=Pseudomonas canadensis TaxID=915099 RepID=UPI0030CAD461
MNSSQPTGVDAQRCVLAMTDLPLQPEFQPLLSDVCATLSPAQWGLDGLYVYGSVARAEAIPGESDLDLTLVFREPPQAELLEQLELTRLALEQRHPEVTKVDFDIGHCAQVLSPENKNRWGFWLKHHCRCVWGNDLSVRFDAFRPSREIAWAINGDFEAVLKGYLLRIDLARTDEARLRLQREASRKLVRSTQLFCPVQATVWPQSLEDHVKLFLQHYPAMVTQLAFFLFEARNPSAEGEKFSARLHAFLDWMVSRQK